MMTLRATGRRAAVLVPWAVALIALGALRSPDPVQAAQPKKKAAKPGASDPFAVPDGTPDALCKYLQKLAQMKPPAQDEKTRQQFTKNVAAAALKAVDKIFAGKPNEEQAEFAVEAKLEVLGVLDGLGDKQSLARLQAFPGELEQLGWPALARYVRGVWLQTRLTRVLGSDAGQLKPVLDDIKKFFAAGALEPADGELALSAALAAERADRAGLAVKVYEDFGKLFSASKDARLAKFGAKLQGAARRLSLLGRPVEIRGVAVDGKPLDWAKYRGTVVLVVFWATGSDASRVELAGILKHYEVYRPKGFDVLAVSMDQDRGALVSFLTENKLPWTVLFDRALRTETADDTMDTRYGIITIPELILVGKDGKVVSMDVRGPALGRELAKLLGGPGPAGLKKGKAGKE